MKSFGSIKFFFLVFVYFPVVPLFSEEVSFRLSQNLVTKGESLELEIRLSGDKSLKLIRNSYEENGVKAVYSGSGSETQIINFKVSRSKIIKFRILADKTGKNKVPPVQVSVENDIVTCPELYFTVESKPPSNRRKGNGSLFDRIFGDPSEEDEKTESPEVVFHTNKQKVYIGEPIVGYYVLYYRGYRQAYLERDPNQSISFPFFLAETLKQVTVQIDPMVVRNGKEKNTLVFEKEIYGLTPLKSGNFTIGSTNFVVGDSMRFGAFQESIPVHTERITVLELPKGKPPGYKGAIGDYHLLADYQNAEIKLGETFYFKIKVSGSGGGDGLDHPLESRKEGLHFLSSQKSKTFRQLSTGEYGFYSEIEYLYSFEPRSLGKTSIGEATIHFFSPSSQSYQTKTLTLPDISVLPNTLSKQSDSWKATKKANADWTGNPYLIWFVVLSIFVGVGTTIVFRRQEDTKSGLIILDQRIGSKKNQILNDYLIKKGVVPKDAEKIVELRSAFPEKSFSEIFRYCDKLTKRMLVETSKLIQ
ncbi:BatD family protein [Leptospira kobayashii]|uniref:BatD family protein n=1 Tax=Leptospira kobayashii TaxID=1917830 RepID=UPI0014356781|nr:BatD family protein [Leptospira kobayashii]